MITKHILSFLLAPFCLLSITAVDVYADSPNKCDNAENVIGRVEYALMQDVGIKLKARIDTGAGVSSIHAKILEINSGENGNEGNVVFQIADEDGNLKTIKRKIVEWANIKVKAAAKKQEARPVVILDFCIAGKKIEGRINLTDRSKFIYPLLIGRNILKTGDFLINPRRKFMKEPSCL